MTQTTLFKPEAAIEKIPTLSLLQPWAQAIFLGLKKIETRSWATKYRGPLLIHASAKKDIVGRDKWEKTRAAMGDTIGENLGAYETLPFGKIIGIVYLTNCRPIETVHRELLLDHNFIEILWGDYSDGRHGWTLASPVSFSPAITYKGALSVWDAVKLRATDQDLLSLEFSIRYNKDPRAMVVYKGTADRLEANYNILRNIKTKVL